jgi:hypothetical protein
MFGFRKSKPRKKNKANAKLAKKLMGKGAGRRIFGFPCSPDIQSQIEILAGQLNVPIYGLVEHMLQLSAGLIGRMVENPEERELLRKHLTETHVEARTVEKITKYDQEMAERLDEERMRRFEVDKAVGQIVMTFVRSGLKPKELPWLIDYGLRCRLAVARGYPIPRTQPPDI